MPDDPATNPAPNVTAQNRSVSIGGNAERNVIVTGDGNAVQQANVDRGQFLEALAELKRQVAESDLPEHTTEAIEAEIVDVETRASGEEPSKELITSRLQTVLALLKDAAGAGQALVPAVRQLGEWAGLLF